MLRFLLLGLLNIGNAEIAGYQRADFVGSTRSPEFANSLNNRADVFGKLR